jgi:futalosine hydrolase
MQLLLCAATEFEIKPVIDFITAENIPDVDVLITGVGMTATTYSLTKAILTRKPDFILQAGVAGCLDASLPLTKVVLVENENIGDLGVNENGNFHSLFDLQLLDQDRFPWAKGKLHNDIAALKQAGLTAVDGVTVNEITTDINQIHHYRKNLNASVESMEGAALHYVALMEKIPFLQLRSLSNFAGERDKTKWVMGTAIANLNIELKRILTKILSR